MLADIFVETSSMGKGHAHIALKRVCEVTTFPLEEGVCNCRFIISNEVLLVTVWIGVVVRAPITYLPTQVDVQADESSSYIILNNTE